MIYLLIFVLVALLAMVVISLFRGLNAFRQTLDEDKEGKTATGASELQLMQNRMMWSRIKYQGLAVVVVAIMLAMSR